MFHTFSIVSKSNKLMSQQILRKQVDYDTYDGYDRLSGNFIKHNHSIKWPYIRTSDDNDIYDANDMLFFYSYKYIVSTMSQVTSITPMTVF